LPNCYESRFLLVRQPRYYFNLDAIRQRYTGDRALSRRAQQILQRRINQSVAEYEVLNTLELSWGGLCTHVREGWNIGKPRTGARPSATATRTP
jgi:hypothetical protein